MLRGYPEPMASPVAEEDVRAIERLADAASCAAEEPVERARMIYAEVRGTAAGLNLTYHWAPPDEFDAMFPTSPAQAEIDRLDDHIGVSAGRAGPAEPLLLRNLSAWAAAVALAIREASTY